MTDALVGLSDRPAGELPQSEPALLEFAVGGMTCGSCAARVERALNRLDGVSANVSYATEHAYVTGLGGRTATDLIAVIESAGYTAELLKADGPTAPLATADAGHLGRRLAVCAPLAVATIVLAMVPAAQFPGWQWISLLLAAPVAIWGAWPLHRAAWLRLGHAAASMDTLVSLGVTASFCWSVYALLFGGAGDVGMRMPFAVTFGPATGQLIYLDAAAGVTVAVLAGRYLEAAAKRRSGSAITALANLGAKQVAVLRGDAEVTLPVESLAVGDAFVVRPGAKIAADGLVIAGTSTVDASMVTGESVPAEVGPGDSVTGGTMNLTGRLVIGATRVGADTTLAQITALVTEALASKASAQRTADKVAGVFVPCVIVMAAVALGFWLGAGLPAASAWSAAVAVLVVACPCALGLATPAALLAALGRGAELGVLIKSAQSLETAGRISTLVLDKTGTLTTGLMSVDAVTTADCTKSEALALAGAVEDGSAHPIGQAIAIEASRSARLREVSGFASVTGAGVRGVVDGLPVIVGSADFLADSGLAIPADLASAALSARQAGRTAVLVGWDQQARAVFSVGDTLRAGCAAAVARLRGLGLDVFILTGDSEEAALAIAGQLAIPPGHVFPALRPAAKARIVLEFRQAGRSVAMVGDGVNDAAALAAADLGMAIGTGSDAAIGASDITLISGEPGAIADAVLLARATMRTIRINLAWAFGYNVIAIPLAALGYLNPLFAGLAMSASSLIVLSNSLLLRRFRPVKGTQ